MRGRFEQDYRAPPLEVPTTGAAPDDILKCSAVSLFISQASACDPRFRAYNENIYAIGTICRRPDDARKSLRQ